MRIQRNQKQLETRYYLSTVDIHVAHIDLTYIQSDQTDVSEEEAQFLILVLFAHTNLC